MGDDHQSVHSLTGTAGKDFAAGLPYRPNFPYGGPAITTKPVKKKKKYKVGVIV